MLVFFFCFFRRWLAELYVAPGGYLLWVGIAVLCTVVALGIPVIILDRMEKVESCALMTIHSRTCSLPSGGSIRSIPSSQRATPCRLPTRRRKRPTPISSLWMHFRPPDHSLLTQRRTHCRKETVNTIQTLREQFPVSPSIHVLSS